MGSLHAVAPKLSAATMEKDLVLFIMSPFTPKRLANCRGDRPIYIEIENESQNQLIQITFQNYHRVDVKILLQTTLWENFKSGLNELKIRFGLTKPGVNYGSLEVNRSVFQGDYWGPHSQRAPYPQRVPLHEEPLGQ